MRSIWQDIRYARRVLRAHPAAVAIAVLSLAVGIGVNTVFFSMVDALLLRPLPISDPDSLVRIQWQSTDGRSSAMAWTDLQALRESAGAFSDIAAQNRRGGLLDIGASPEMKQLTIVSDNYFPLLGITAERGRLFRADLDDQPGNEPVVVITDGLWRSRFGADPNIVGRPLRINYRTLTVVGILPPEFRGLHRIIETDLWIPVSSWRAMGQTRELEERVVGHFEPVGRLRQGSSIGAAQAQLDTLTARIQAEQPEAARGRRLVVRTQADYEEAGGFRLVSALVLGIAGLLVVIACANVAQLLLALSEARRREIAVRQALGASRRRLLRQLLTESAMLAIAGTVVALLTAVWLIPILPALLPSGPSFFRPDFRLDHRVLMTALATCTFTVLIFGLIPAIQGSRTDLNSLIKTSGWQSRRRFSGRNLLVVSQSTLSVVLMVSAGLLATSFVRVQGVRPGFDTGRNTVVVLTSLNGPSSSVAATSDEIVQRVGALTGMKQGAYCRRLPMASSGGGATQDVEIPGRAVPSDQAVLRIRYNQISPDYFAVTGTRLIAGRPFARADAAAATKVSLINDTMARQFFPAGDAVGRWIRVNNADVQIVGIVENAAVNSLHEKEQPFLYFPYAQMPAGEVTFLFETVGDPSAMVPAIKREMRAVAPTYAELSVNTMKRHMRDALYMDWLQAVLSIALAVIGVGLAAVGLVGVVSQSVTRRRREIGIRAAMGARRRDVVLMVLKQGLVLSGVGAVVGVGAALLVGQAMSSLLYGVSPSDPIVLGLSATLVVVIGLLGSVYPAWKASRVDPVHVLRAE